MRAPGALSLSLSPSPSRWKDLDSAASADDVLCRDIVVIEGLLTHPSVALLGDEAFSMETLRRERAGEVVMIIRQQRGARGWRMPTQRVARKPLGPYLTRMIRECGGAEGGDGAGAGAAERAGGDGAAAGGGGPTAALSPTLEFAANIDIAEWAPQMRALRRALPRWLACQGPDDVLRFCRQPVFGVTLPQMYLKLAGCWTGGHEENVRFQSINVNHGPGPSRWWAVGARYAPRLRALVSREFGVDVYSRESEGNWWPDARWLRARGVPVRTGLQRAGDVVVLRGGTLHWVRALGPAAVATSWNFGRFDEAQFAESLERYDINNALSPRMHSLVPMQTLCLDVARRLLREHRATARAARRATRRADAPAGTAAAASTTDAVAIEAASNDTAAIGAAATDADAAASDAVATEAEGASDADIVTNADDSATAAAASAVVTSLPSTEVPSSPTSSGEDEGGGGRRAPPPGAEQDGGGGVPAAPFTLADDAPFSDDDSESEDDGPDGTGRAPAHAALLALGPLRGDAGGSSRDAEASASGGEAAPGVPTTHTPPSARLMAMLSARLNATALSEAIARDALASSAAVKRATTSHAESETCAPRSVNERECLAASARESSTASEDDAELCEREQTFAKLKRFVRHAELRRLEAAVAAHDDDDDDDDDARRRFWDNRTPALRVTLEPPGAMVLACDVCRAEIVHTYVRCETCLGAQARASASGAQPPPAFLCCACGEAHASEKSTHNIIVLEKEPHGRLRRTVREFAAFAADAIGTVRSASPCPRDGAWLLPSLFNGEETRLKPVAPRRAPSVGKRGRAAAAGARGAVANRVKPAVSRTLSGSEGMSGALFHKREAARALARGARSGPAASPPALGASDGPEAIGRRIEVFWPEDDTWYGGRVAEFNATSGEHKIRYDDGDVELIALSTETFRWGTEPAAKRRRVVRVPQVILDASPPPWELRKEALAAGGAAAAGPPPRALATESTARTDGAAAAGAPPRALAAGSTEHADGAAAAGPPPRALASGSTARVRAAGPAARARPTKLPPQRAQHDSAALEMLMHEHAAPPRSRKRGRALSETPRGHGTSWGSVAAALLPQRAQTFACAVKSILRLEAANDAVQREAPPQSAAGQRALRLCQVHHLARLLALLDEYSDARWHELGRRAVAERDDDDGDGGHAMAQLVEADDATRTRAAAIEGELWARATAGASGAGAAAEEAAASGDAQPRDVIDTYRRLVEEKIEREMERAARELLPVHAQLQDGWRRRRRLDDTPEPAPPVAEHALEGDKGTPPPPAPADGGGVAPRRFSPSVMESSPPLPAPPLALPYGPSPPLFSQAMLPPAMPTLTDIHASLSTLPMSAASFATGIAPSLPSPGPAAVSAATAAIAHSVQGQWFTNSGYSMPLNLTPTPTSLGLTATVPAFNPIVTAPLPIPQPPPVGEQVADAW